MCIRDSRACGAAQGSGVIPARHTGCLQPGGSFRGERALVTTLTVKMAEDLTDAYDALPKEFSSFEDLKDNEDAIYAWFEHCLLYTSRCV